MVALIVVIVVFALIDGRLSWMSHDIGIIE